MTAGRPHFRELAHKKKPRLRIALQQTGQTQARLQGQGLGTWEGCDLMMEDLDIAGNPSEASGRVCNFEAEN